MTECAMRNLLLFIFIMGTLGAVSAQSVADISGIRVGDASTTKIAQVNLKLGDLDKALLCYSMAIREAKDNRKSGSGVDGTLMAEYAYTLALHHDFVAALIAMDRARALGTKYGDFDSAQVLTVMGHEDAARQLMDGCKVPDWINGIFQTLTPKYAVAPVYIGTGTSQDVLTRANKLSAGRQSMQSIVLFEELAAKNPKVYMVYVDYSALWENLGRYAYAGHLLEKGIRFMPRDTATAEMRGTFESHLASLRKTDSTVQQSPIMKSLVGKEPPRMIMYAGASVANKVYSLNGRFGLYGSNKLSASLNIGLSIANGQFRGSMGISAYKAWSVFVAGLGVGTQFTTESFTLGITPSVGLSFLNKAQTSSFDITLNGFVPVVSESSVSYSLSIGKTFYIDVKNTQR